MSKLNKIELEIQEKLLEVKKLILEIEELAEGSCMNIIGELFTTSEIEDAHYGNQRWKSSSDDC